jgi:hypothetical protein
MIAVSDPFTQPLGGERGPLRNRVADALEELAALVRSRSSGRDVVQRLETATDYDGQAVDGARVLRRTYTIVVTLQDTDD